MKHIIIMPEDCYKSSSERFEGRIVRKSGMGVETPAAFDEVRYIVSDFSPEAIAQAFQHHTCDCVANLDDGGHFPCRFSWVPKPQKYKMVEYA